MSKAPSSPDFEAELGALLPPGASLVVWSEDLGIDPLGPEEAMSMTRAVASRRLEFARGRTCARVALERAGFAGGDRAVPHPQIPVGSSREPVWPVGFTGSITHCDGLVAAICAPRSVLRGIGLDAEVDRPLPPEVVPQVITPEEVSQPDAADHLVRFSAKESIHKTVFPLTGVWLDFLDVSVTLGPGNFRGRPAEGARSRVEEVAAVRGRYLRLAGFVVTLAWV